MSSLLKYILKHKDIPVLKFESDGENIVSLDEVLNQEHLPLALQSFEVEQKTLTDVMRKWWQGRAIPESRQNLREARETLGNISIASLVTKSMGLSLSDHYWAHPVELNLYWKDVNFFENEFSEDVGRALFGIWGNDGHEINLISPDNTSDGWLKKRWIINNNQRILVKGGTGLEQQEPFNEVLATEICTRLNIPCVKYSLITEEFNYYSSCQNFLSSNLEFVPASYIYNLKPFSGGLWDKFSHFKDCCNLAGIKDSESTERDITQMLFVDFIIANIDRHWGNFGFIRNSTTLEWKGLAPVFDSGSSMFYKIPTPALSDEKNTSSKNITARPFGYNHKDQINLLPVKQYCNSFPMESLNDISDWFEKLLKANGNMTEERRCILCKLLQSRRKEAMKFLS